MEKVGNILKKGIIWIGAGYSWFPNCNQLFSEMCFSLGRNWNSTSRVHYYEKTLFVINIITVILFIILKKYQGGENGL